MSGEVEWQAKVVKRLKLEGCYARKASSSYAVGVLDLDVIIPEFGGMKIEMKMEKELKLGATWHRTLGYTEKQKEEAEKIRAAGGAVLGLVVCHFSASNVSMHAHTMPQTRAEYVMTSGVHNVDRVQWSPSIPDKYLSKYLIKTWENHGKA